MSEFSALPRIIQGGMGVGVSNWRLARAVSRHGQLGVVSGTGIDTVLVRRLQDGDPGGHVRHAMERFPLAHAAADALRLYFRPEGRAHLVLQVALGLRIEHGARDGGADLAPGFHAAIDVVVLLLLHVGLERGVTDVHVRVRQDMNQRRFDGLLSNLAVNYLLAGHANRELQLVRR